MRIPRTPESRLAAFSRWADRRVDRSRAIPSVSSPTALAPAASARPGFGLSIVETICRAHGWDIDLVDGPGARFEVTGVGPSDHVYPLGDELSRQRSDGRRD